MANPDQPNKPNQTYNVHLYVVVRVKVPNVEAASMVDANKKAYEQIGDHLHHYFGCDAPKDLPGVEHVEFADELSHALTDVVGDQEYKQSKWFQNDLQTPMLLEGEQDETHATGTEAERS